MKSTRTSAALVAWLHEARGADLLGYLRRRLRSEAAARDIAQEAYLRFIRLGDPARIENAEAYLFRIAANLLWEHRLRTRDVPPEDRADETPATEYTPFELACSAEVAERIRAALNGLPAMQRAVVILHLRDGLTCAQIAAQAGISASMVKKHLAKAIATCRLRLKDLREHDDER
jgi:RNA polymerase sigma-70 factor (ECF subfamily)